MPADRPPDRRNPQRERARMTIRRLMDAGLESFAEHGYHAARVDDVVRRARTSHGTFYLYFADKEDLLRALAAECAEKVGRLVDGLDDVGRDDESYERLRRWVEEFIDAYAVYGPVIRAWMEHQAGDRAVAALGDDLFGDVTARVARRLEQAGVAHLPDARAAAVALVGMVERFSYFLTSRALPFDREDTVDNLAVLVHRGFLGGSPRPVARAAS